MTDDDETVELLRIYVSPSQLKVLQKLRFPGSDEVVKSAKVTDRGIMLSGSRREFEDLVGWVSGEAKHGRERAPVRTELLEDLTGALESALVRRR